MNRIVSGGETMQNISFDIVALLIYVLLIISVISRKMTKSRSNKLFILTMIIGLATTVFDILSVLSDQLGNSAIVFRAVCHTLYLDFHVLQTPIFALLIISYMEMWQKFVSKKAVLVLFWFPYAAVTGLLIANLSTGIVFTLENGYAHGMLFWVLYAVSAAYLAAEALMLIAGRKFVTALQLLALFGIIALCITAIVIQMFFPKQLLECIAISLGCYILTSTIQRPEDYIDVTTGLLKLSAYTRDARNGFNSGNHWHVVMLNIANYESVVNLVGFDQATELVQIIADKIFRLNKDLGRKGLAYYLDRARFRITFPEHQRALAETYATLLNNDLKQKIRHNGFDISLVPCIILARCPEEIESFKSLMSFGQDFHLKMLHTGKVMMGKDVYDPDEFKVSNNIDNIIEKALENNSFQVYYQPIYSIEKKKYVSAEALLRLYDEEHGFINPEVIITAAERSGAIHKIGEFVFEEVCKFISSGEVDRLGLDYIEVNLSVAQCMHGDLADKILRTMQQYNVPTNKINLEITETAASYAQRVMTENLNKLSRSGVSFSLDDYGTGYSNMKRVISLPLKIVKLDKSFVDEKHNPKMWIFLQNTVQMLKAMNMQIVVEGIESQEMVDAFSAINCDYIQGYFFSRPLPMADFVKLVESSREPA